MNFILGICIFLSLTTLLKCEAQLELTGSNVCSKIVEHVTEVLTPTSREYDEVISVWCNWIKRCNVRVRKTETVMRPENKTESKELKECCDGYSRNLKGNQCLPICDCIEDNSTCDGDQEAGNCIIGVKCNFQCPSGCFGWNCTKFYERNIFSMLYDCFTGDDCKDESSSSGVYIAGGCVVAILIFVIVFVFLYRRRQTLALGRTTADVEYHARGLVFENPGYETDVSKLLNNDLDTSGKARRKSIQLKTPLSANFDETEEPIYDEPVRRDTYFNPGYDHLNQLKTATAIKPNYNRLQSMEMVPISII